MATYNSSNSLQEDLVLSEVHLYNKFTTTAEDDVALSRFFFSNPQSKFERHSQEVTEIAINPSRGLKGGTWKRDDDGDLILERPSDHKKEKDVITIEHTLATPLSSVGTQVWCGSLLLCDFLVHHQSKFEGCIAIELGGGVGLCSIVMARTAIKVFCTDICQVLDFSERNRIRNQELFHYRSEDNPVMIVRELDFFQPPLTPDVRGMAKYDWTADDKALLNRISLVIAADVIYDDRLTEAFLETVMRLFDLSPGAVLYLALEKRLNFTLDDLDVASPAYDNFFTKLEEMNTQVVVERVPTTFPQYFEYKRVKQLVRLPYRTRV